MTKLAILLLVAIMATACRSDAPPKPRAHQEPALVDLTASLDAARVAFNAHEAEPRFLTLLSAT